MKPINFKIVEREKVSAFGLEPTEFRSLPNNSDGDVSTQQGKWVWSLEKSEKYVLPGRGSWL